MLKETNEVVDFTACPKNNVEKVVKGVLDGTIGLAVRRGRLIQESVLT